MRENYKNNWLTFKNDDCRKALIVMVYYNKQEGNYIHENKNEQNTGTKTIKKIGK